jgi:hypothetical protein
MAVRSGELAGGSTATEPFGLLLSSIAASLFMDPDGCLNLGFASQVGVKEDGGR